MNDIDNNNNEFDLMINNKLMMNQLGWIKNWLGDILIWY